MTAVHGKIPTITDRRVLPLAFSMLKGTGMAFLRHIEENGLSLDEFFRLPSSDLVKRLSLRNASVVDAMLRNKAIERALQELIFCDSHSIRVLFPDDENYPLRLRQLHDAPTALFILGDCDLNPPKALSFVGTRTPTPYGVNFTRTAVLDLADIHRPMIVSGLAYGIDSVAHTAALEAEIPTVAVVAHGLDTIYPAPHRDLARRIIHQGGAIISEYPRGEKPFRNRFLERNRIVAGLSDGCVIAESDIRGGAMSTAAIAFGIDREVMALPGRISDKFSSGCNHLIRKNRAWLICNARDISSVMNWGEEKPSVDAMDRSLFPELDEPQKSIFETLAASTDPVGIDTLHATTGYSAAILMSQLNDMEFEGLVVKYPGNRYLPA